MKRFHVHLRVQDLEASIAFYSRLFAQAPAKTETDYAKWMLEDPAVNFAISTRGTRTGIDHLGIQVDDAQTLETMKAQAREADFAMLDEGATTCCYARSDKYWVTDPQGIAWEQFQTLGDVPVYGESQDRQAGSACCGPTEASGPAPVAGSDTVVEVTAADAAAGGSGRCCG
jgi:catechol 2,3-dioxygenase-like lactoylglutathione lyase family enzyme